MILNKATVDWAAIEADQRFIKLHKEKNRFLWRMMLFALVYFFCLPIATAYFQDIFSIKIWGVINLGLIFALSQFIVAWGIAAFYAKRANEKFDTQAKALLDDVQNISTAKGA